MGKRRTPGELAFAYGLVIVLVVVAAIVAVFIAVL